MLYGQPPIYYLFFAIVAGGYVFLSWRRQRIFLYTTVSRKQQPGHYWTTMAIHAVAAIGMTIQFVRAVFWPQP